MFFTRIIPIILIGLSLLAALPARTVYGQSWLDPVNGSWSDSARWSGNQVPNSGGADATINAVGSSYLVTGDINIELNSLLLNSSEAELRLTGRAWTIHNGINVTAGELSLRGTTNLNGAISNAGTITVLGANSGGNANVSVGSINNSGSLILSSINTSWSSNLTGNVTNSGLFHSQVGAGGSRTFAGSLINTGDVIIDQQLNITGASSVFEMTGGSVTANAPLIVAGGTMRISTGSLTGAVVVNGGALEMLPGSTATGLVNVRGNSTIDGIVNAGLTVRVQGANFGGQANLVTQTGFENHGLLLLESTNSSWNSNLDATAGLVNASSGTLAVLQGSGGSRGIFGNIVNQGTIDGTDRAYRQSSGSLELAGGQLLGDVITLATDVSLSGNTAGNLFMQGNSNTLTGTVNSGLTVNLRGASDGGDANTIIVGGSLSNGGVVMLDSINTSWGSAMTGDFVNQAGGLLQTATGAGGARNINGLLTNYGTLDFQADTTIVGGGLKMMSGSLTSGGRTAIDLTSLEIQGGNVSGEVVVRNGQIDFLAGSTLSGAVQSRGNATTLSGAINAGATVQIMGSSFGGDAILTTEAGASNFGTMQLDSINSSWSSTLNVGNGFVNHGSIQILPGAEGNRLVTGTLENHGTLDGTARPFRFNGDLTLAGGGILGELIVSNSTVSFASPAEGQVVARGTNVQVGGSIGPNATLWVNGSSGSSAGHAFITTNGLLKNYGTLVMESSSTSWDSTLQGSLMNMSGGLVEVNQGTGGQRNLQFALDNAGEFIFRSNANLGLAGATHQNDGVVTMESGTLIINGDSFTNSGTIRGNSTINVSGVNFLNDGIIAPGLSAGTLNLIGDFEQSALGSLAIELGGLGAGEFDVLAISGNAFLDGELSLSLINGFATNIGDQFRILTTTGSVSGAFIVLPNTTHWEVVYGNNYVDVVSLTAIPEPSSAILTLVGFVIAMTRRTRRS